TSPSAQAFWTACVAFGASPAMVTILSPAPSEPTGTEHERRTSPLMCTEQEPHCATPQPYLVPVSPACSRSAHSSGVSASTSRSRTCALMFSFAISHPPWTRYAFTGADFTSLRRTLPTLVFGSSFQNSTIFGTLYPVRCCLQC